MSLRFFFPLPPSALLIDWLASAVVCRALKAHSLPIQWIRSLE